MNRAVLACLCCAAINLTWTVCRAIADDGIAVVNVVAAFLLVIIAAHSWEDRQ